MKTSLALSAILCVAMSATADNIPNVNMEGEASSIIQLTDANFEKLTQASTGSTTGPWFIKFYAPWCSHCRHMAPAWERLAKELKGVVNIADLDATKNPNVAKRFAIKGYPTLILIDKGKMYMYKGGERTTEKLAAFATVEYEKTLSSAVPAPLTYVGVMVDFVVSGVQEAQRIYDVAFRGFFVIASFCFLLGMIVGMIFCVILLSKVNSPAPNTKTAKISARKQD